MSSGKTIKEIEQNKYNSIMNTVSWRAGYYRRNPHRFVKEFLGLDILKWFQKILLWAMMNFDYFMFIAARSLGKTWLTALFCVCRAILYPGSKIVVCSGTLQQANEVLLKIKDEFYPKSAMLRNEIKDMFVNQNKGEIYFGNGSWIKTRTSTANSRSARANLIVVDEFRMVDKTILDTVIRRFLGDPRHPEFLNKPEYKNNEELLETNKEVYMSSAWLKDHWSWKKAQSYTLNFFNDKRKYFITGLPYQLAIREGLLLRSQVENEMSEKDFSQTLWSMEMETMWLGDTEGSFFRLEDINKHRTLERGLYPLEFYNEDIKIPPPPESGKRVLSLDIALMASNKKKKNDASSYFWNDAELINDVRYRSNYIYSENHEGLTTDQLGLRTMRYFYKYQCDYLVLDCNGVGIGVFDYIICNHFDPETGEEYKALTCINDEDMASRCKVPDANKVVYSVKANARFNTQICTLLRDKIRNGTVNFLKSELMVDEYLTKAYKPYKNLSPTEQAKLKTGYLQTTLAAYELIKLQTLASGNEIKVKEGSDARKDRYSSLAYNQWCISQLEQELQPRNADTQTLIDKMIIRRGSYHNKKI